MRKTGSTILGMAAALAVAGLNASVDAASLAADTSANYTTYTNFDGGNNGTGFGAFHFVQSGTTGGGFVNSVASGGFDIYDNGVQNGGAATDQMTAIRPFTGALSAGQTFSFTESLNYNSNATNGGPGHLGFSFEDAGGTALFDLHTEGGGYLLTDANNNKAASGIGYNYHTPTVFSFTLLDATTGAYSLTAGTTTVTGNIAVGSGGVSQFAIYNNNGGGGSDVVFDNLSITGTPEPASLSLCGLAGLTALRRRR